MTEILDPMQNEPMAEAVAEEKKTYATREEIIARLEEIVSESSDTVKSEVTYLKMLYYKMRQQETDAALQALLENEDADALSYESKPDELEDRLKELLNIHKEHRAAMVEARNKELAENCARKTAILDQMEALATDANDINVHYPVFMDLQKQFKEIGTVDSAVANDLWKRYAQVTENFYDLLKINKELRDYDFKKNQEKKEALCVEAERLGDAGDVLAAFRRLQELHEEWKGIGPVAPVVREEIWARFKAASTVVNKRHQEHFEQIKAKESENEAGKTALCEKIEAIDLTEISTVKGWEEKTAVVLGIQEEWRKLGFASRKVNNQLFERFRKSCDKFFEAKALFFKTMKEGQAANLEKKIRLCEKAEALKDSQEWRKTTDQFIALQKEWKTIGPVPRKQANAIWKRFLAACDAFFEAKEKAVGSERAEEKANLEKKQAIIARLKELKETVAEVEASQIREIMAEWNTVGHVPFKEKDKLFKEYQVILDFFFDKLDMKGTKARMSAFANNLSKLASGDKAESALLREREKLMRVYERLNADLKTYENNLGFLTLASKSGNSLLREVEKKKESLKAEIQTIVEKIELIDKNIEQQ